MSKEFGAVVYWAYCERHAIHYPEDYCCERCLEDALYRQREEERRYEEMVEADQEGWDQDDVPGELRSK